MKDILSKLEQSIRTTAKEAAEQTQKSVDQAVYRAELVNKKNELKKLYQQLGMAKYEDYAAGSEDAKNMPLYLKIDTLRKEIDDREKQVEDIVRNQKDSFDTYKRGVKTTWSEEMAREARPEAGPDGVEVMKICPCCNAGNHTEAEFCINCGNKF